MKALCVRVVQRHRLGEGMPPLLLAMPDAEWEVEKEEARRAREEAAAGERRK